MTQHLRDVASLIQLAVAPVFLLMAVATSLMIFTSRLARIVDRGRQLEEGRGGDEAARRAEQDVLDSRARLIYLALTFGVCAALCVSLLMTAAFVGPLLGRDTGKPVAALFLLALFAYTAALVCLLREVFLAVAAFGRRRRVGN